MSEALTPVSFRKGRTHLPRLSKPYEPGRKHERYWTEAEQDIIRKYYPKGGCAACQTRLPGRRRLGIYQRARILGVKFEGGRGAGRKVKFVAPAGIDDRIRVAWPNYSAGAKKRLGVAAMADELGVPRRFLYARALELGLDVRPYKKQPPWTKAEDELMRRVPLHDPEKCARLFKDQGFARSPAAICVRARRLNLRRRDTRTTLSATEAAKILGMDSKTLVAGYIIPGLLKAVKRNDLRLPQQGGSAWDIEPDDFRRFIVDQLERIDFRRVDKFAFVDLLVNVAIETPAAERVVPA